MLRRLGLVCFDLRLLSRCRPSIVGLRSRSIHHVPSGGHRREPASDSPPAKDNPAAAGWVMLNAIAIRNRNDESSLAADAKTAADFHTPAGRHLLRVSLATAPPPASSFLYYDFPDGSPGGDDDNINDWHISVVTAHGDSVLLEMSDRHRRYEEITFLYRAAGAARPPSLSLLPGVRTREYFTGLLRPVSDDQALLVQLHLLYDRSLNCQMAEFCVLHVGATHWEFKEPVPIHHDDGDKPGDMLQRYWDTEDTVPVGDRFLCLVGYKSGFFMCDMADVDNPKVRYVTLPHDMSRCNDDYDNYDNQQPSFRKFPRSMGAAGASTVRFVSVDLHCCCGDPGRSTCSHYRYAFTINSWIMDLGVDEPLTWVRDAEIDCEELWALPGYEGLPRANFQYPVVSLDNPNVVCFLVSNFDIASWNEDKATWMIQLNMKTKTLLSAVQFTNGDTLRPYHHLPAKLEC